MTDKQSRISHKMALQVPHIVCFTCQKRISHYQERFRLMRMGKATNEELFAVLDLKEHYDDFLEQKNRGHSDEMAFNNIGLSNIYPQYSSIKNQPLTPDSIYEMFGIKRICCMRCICNPPIWPDYSPNKPPNSKIEVDSGQIKRLVNQNGSGFQKREVIGEDITFSNIDTFNIVEDYIIDGVGEYVEEDEDINAIDI